MDDLIGAVGKGVQPPDGTTERLSYALKAAYENAIDGQSGWVWEEVAQVARDRLLVKADVATTTDGVPTAWVAACPYCHAVLHLVAREAVCAEPSMSTTSPSADSGTDELKALPPLPQCTYLVDTEAKRHGMHPAYRNLQNVMKYGGESTFEMTFTADQLYAYARAAIEGGAKP